ncbi:MAG TPA: glycosyltransferase family 4 protein [Cyclobacteriaceae bacterium]|nr:glycosyltransferase family 4 protein [Cyclobacteriaceae bacterium]
MKKRVLIITYYWPPSGGSGVQRWLKFVKYLSQQGWEPYVFTPENPHFAIQDSSLLKDVPPQVEIIRFPIWEPYQTFNRLTSIFSGKKMQQVDFVGTGKKTLLQKFGMWVRGNFFIPDARRFWIKPSVEYLNDFVQRNQIDKIITTGPPHSIHLIGRGLKRKNTVLKWVADFRDPWSEWDLLDTLQLSSWARNRHKQLERSVLQEADLVLTVTPYYVKQFQQLGGKNVQLITNGFDEDDFKSIQHQRTSKFTIRHIGGVDELRDPRPAMLAIKSLCEQNADFSNAVKIEFIGSVNASFKNFIEQDTVLALRVTFVNQLPHSELLKLYGSTDVLLLVLAHAAHAAGNIPGKLFEYLASGNEIIGVGASDGDSAIIVRNAGAGVVHEPNDQKGFETAFLKSFAHWKSGTKPDSKTLTNYSRRVLTDRLIALLEAFD